MGLILGLTTAGGVRAQVGHVPERSPYRDVRAGQAVQFLAGYVWGETGAAQAGPANGPVFGARYDRRVSTPIDIQAGAAVARLERLIVDPSRLRALRLTGPVKGDLAILEAGFSLVITGRKSWRGLVPYLGGTVGAVILSDQGGDASPFRFRTKFMWAPHVGIKLFPVQAVAIKVEARDYAWRLTYPAEFYLSPLGAPSEPPVLTAPQGNEWTHHPTLFISVGYTFTS